MKRKARDKEVKNKHDVSKPISIDIFGTEDDPCFGKHYSEKADECSMCGDSELCFIIKSQKQHKVREFEEEEANFKDLEEPFFNLVKLEEYLIKKLKPNNKLLITSVYSKVNKRFNKLGQVSKKEVKSAVLKVVKNSKKIVLYKNRGVRKIKLKQ
jgi:hypothetical protein